MSIRAIMKNGRPMAMMYETSEAKKYKKDFMQYVKKEVKKQKWIMSENKYQHYYVDAFFYFPRIDMDCNNYWKCMFDSITESECVWIDDNQSCERVAGINYDSKNPRIELLIHPVDYTGVFKNSSQLDTFTSNCIECTRYNRNCSIYKNAIEGRIQEEIICETNGVKCLKRKCSAKKKK
jgi:Holliday junction resolvase RusA-like endonuclease